MKTPIRLVLSTVVLLTSMWAAPGAFAEEPLRSETVKFPDLNVDTPSGAQTLYSRIHEAAKRVCEQRDPVMQAGVLSCIRKTEANAIQYLNLPQLTAYYQGKTGNRSQPVIAQR